MSDTNVATTIKDMLNSEYVKKRFAEVMGEKSAAFLASVLNVMRVNPSLKDCNPQSVISAAMVAATLDLPIDGSLGFAAIVPYRNKGIQVAQFQIMTKGFVQLALRTGQYKAINVGPIYKDEYDGYDIITGEVKIHPVAGGFRDKNIDESLDNVAGYAAYFRLINGYECMRFWTMDKILAHGKRYSKSFDNQFGMWKTNLPAMAAKTVLKNTLSRWGILSTSMQMAVKTDQAVVRRFDKAIEEQDIEYVDGDDNEAEPRAPEDIVKSAEKSAEPGKKGPPSDPAKTPEEVWGLLIEYGNASNLPETARKDIEAAIARKEADPIILRALLAKVEAAYKKAE